MKRIYTLFTLAIIALKETTASAQQQVNIWIENQMLSKQVKEFEFTINHDLQFTIKAREKTQLEIVNGWITELKQITEKCIDRTQLTPSGIINISIQNLSKDEKERIIQLHKSLQERHQSNIEYLASMATNQYMHDQILEENYEINDYLASNMVGKEIIAKLETDQT